MNVDPRIKALFEPESVAIIGATPTPDKIGNRIMDNIVHYLVGETDRSKGFQGKIYPIHPKAEEIMGYKAYKSILDVPDSVDQAIIVVPPKFVMQVLEECGQKGVKAAVIITAGFGETGKKDAEKDIVAIARKYDMRIVGPNCLGIYNPYIQFNGTFADEAPQKGTLAFISQSGALCISAILHSNKVGIGYSHFVSIGNKADVDDSDLLEYFANDYKTKCIGLYVESMPDGRKFYEEAKKITWRQPIVVLKSGRTTYGASAASSHTGSISTADSSYDAAFKQAGVYRAKEWYELFDVAQAFSTQVPPDGENIALVSNAGGVIVISADKAADIGLKLAKLSDETISRIDEVCPPTWSRQNPVDVIGDADHVRFRKVLQILVDSPEVDGICPLFNPGSRAIPDKVAEAIYKVGETTKKPIVAAFVGMDHLDAFRWLNYKGIPTLPSAERAIVAMKALVDRGKFLRRENIDGLTKPYIKNEESV
ncbi:MAG: acetate--CoA ligase family protein [Candidatus Heimdallarchaeaceae archaeon]